MRRLPALLSLVIAVPVAVTFGSVVGSGAPSPHPVVPHINHLQLAVAAAPHVAAPLVAQLPSPVASIAPENTASFRMVGLSWQHDPALRDLSAEIRVRTDGVWTPWQPTSSTDSGADGPSTEAQGAPRDATEPLWVDHADAVEARVISVTGPAPQGLRVDLINPGTSAADANPSGSTSGLQTAQAATTEPTIITRAQWGADESLRTTACPSGPEVTGAPQVAFVHHTATSNAYAPGDSAAIVRSIYAYHVLSNGWCDIGYNFLVDQYGQVFEGRYGGVDKAILGAHTGGFNTDSFGVAMIGTYNTVTPSAALETSLAQLIAWKLSLSYADPVGQATLTAADFSGSLYPTGTKVTFNVISGHRDADSTDCPGNAGYATLPALAQQVLQDMGAGLVAPASVITGRTVAANGNVAVTAGMLAAGSWQLTVQDTSGNTVRTISGNGAGTGTPSDIATSWDMTNDSGVPVPAGLYTMTLSSTQNGVSALPWSTPITIGGVFGSVDNAVPGGSKVEVTGYALRGVDTGTATVRVTVSAVTQGTGLATLPRTDIAATYAAYGSAHGFDVTVPATPGFHTVCVYGVNSDLGLPDSLLRCQGVTVLDFSIGPFNRLAGPDRYGTAVAIGQAAAPTSTTVVIASGLTMPDAVAAGPLAAHLRAPLLLTSTDSLPAADVADISERAATTAYLVGGTAVIDANVVADLQAAGITTITRLGGVDRYQTAALVAAQIGSANHAAIVVDGDNAHLIDGFTVGGIAGALGEPILMATTSGVPAFTSNELTALGITTTTVIGGSLPAAIVSSLPGGTAVAGADRYATSVAVASTFAAQVGAGTTVLADGDTSFPVDALSAAALGRPTLLVTPTALPAGVASWLATGASTTAVVAVGGPVAISDTVAGTAAGDANLT
jgi:ell wall binding domain 2 (CWB2)/N-acetylmuramoyl-L-alanine amidase/FlgD Ig-like domain